LILIQGRKYVQKVIKDFLKERISAPQRQNRDFLDIVVEDLQNGGLVDENFMVDVVAGFIFAGIALTPTTLALAPRHEISHGQPKCCGSTHGWDFYTSSQYLNF
jgi:hypothetical protein